MQATPLSSGATGRMSSKCSSPLCQLLRTQGSIEEEIAALQKLSWPSCWFVCMCVVSGSIPPPSSQGQVATHTRATPPSSYALEEIKAKLLRFHTPYYHRQHGNPQSAHWRGRAFPVPMPAFNSFAHRSRSRRPPPCSQPEHSAAAAKDMRSPCRYSASSFSRPSPRDEDEAPRRSGRGWSD